MNNQDLEKIAYNLIADKIARGDEVQMAWAVKELIDGRGEISGEGVDFYTFCAREHTYRVVKRAVDKCDDGSIDGDPKQMKMQGFDHLQVAYTVERNGERVLVPIDSISDAQLLARAEDYKKQSKGLNAHAEEIRDYVAKRIKTASQP